MEGSIMKQAQQLSILLTSNGKPFLLCFNHGLISSINYKGVLKGEISSASQVLIFPIKNQLKKQETLLDNID